MNLDDIEKIVKFLSTSDIQEFELEQDGVKLKLNRGKVVSAELSASASRMIQQFDATQSVITQAPAAANFVAPGAATAAAANEYPAHYVEVKSPIVGTFYGKPSPDAESFVTEGTKVKKGDTLCIIEAMKIMNEIEAPRSGVVRKIRLSDGEVVEFGEVLFAIEPE